MSVTVKPVTDMFRVIVSTRAALAVRAPLTMPLSSLCLIDKSSICQRHSMLGTQTLRHRSRNFLPVRRAEGCWQGSWEPGRPGGWQSYDVRAGTKYMGTYIVNANKRMQKNTKIIFKKFLSYFLLRFWCLGLVWCSVLLLVRLTCDLLWLLC